MLREVQHRGHQLAPEVQQHGDGVRVRVTTHGQTIPNFIIKFVSASGLARVVSMGTF